MDGRETTKQLTLTTQYRSIQAGNRLELSVASVRMNAACRCGLYA